MQHFIQRQGQVYLVRNLRIRVIEVREARRELIDKVRCRLEARIHPHGQHGSFVALRIHMNKVQLGFATILLD